MPLYDYLCQKCGHRFEKIQKFSDRIVTKCPECGGRVERVISAPAVQFKGSGWYVTDYASKSQASSSPDGGKDSQTGEKAKAETAGKDESAKRDSARGDSAKDNSGKESSSKESSSKESSAREAKASQSKRAEKHK
jgi:putative FmdB family regulatory protein